MKNKNAIYYKFIESCLIMGHFYNGRLLTDVFKISKVRASQIIQSYIKDFEPAIKYFPRRHEYRALDEFKPQLIKRKNAAVYLQSLNVIYKEEY